MTTSSHYMRHALRLAERGWGQVAPNPLVGAVVVRDGAIVGEGWHERFGAAHAEVMALRAAGDRARGATVYVTLEPCNHQGKTPPCTEALIAAGVARVVIAAADPHPEARGGAARLRAAGIEVEGGVLEEEARELNAPFFHALESDRPWVVLKLALSLDGAIADRTGKPRWLTGPESRREVHRLRAGADAVAVGIGTALADDPALTVRDAPAPRFAPIRVVFDSRLRLPLESQLVRTARELPTLVVAAPDAPAERERALVACGARVVRAPDAATALRTLRADGIRSILVEGGARLGSALLERSLVDRVIIFQAPIVLGAGALNGFAALPARDATDPLRFRALSRTAFGPDLMTIYACDTPAGTRAAPTDGA